MKTKTKIEIKIKIKMKMSHDTRHEAKDSLISGGFGRQHANMIATAMSVAGEFLRPKNSEGVPDDEAVQLSSDVTLPAQVVLNPDPLDPKVISIHRGEESAMVKFVVDYLKASGGWPAQVISNTEKSMTKHPKWPCCVAAGLPPVGELDAPFTDWRQETQSMAGAEAWVVTVRKNRRKEGPGGHALNGFAQLLYSATQDIYVQVIDADYLLSLGVCIENLAQFLEESPKALKFYADGGEKSCAFKLWQGDVCFIPYGCMASCLFYQPKKVGAELGHVLSIPLFVESWAKDITKNAMQAVKQYNHEHNAKQTMPMYTARTEFVAKWLDGLEG